MSAAYISRDSVRNVRCPECGAGPGAPCTGERGQARIGNHGARIAVARTQAGAYSTADPQATSLVRIAKSFVRSVPCPECGARPGAHCTGERGDFRTRNHEARVEAARGQPGADAFIVDREVPEDACRRHRCPECGAFPGSPCAGARAPRERSHTERAIEALNALGRENLPRPGE